MAANKRLRRVGRSKSIATVRIAAGALLLVSATLRCTSPAEASLVPVRFAEGNVHGFLVVRNSADSVLAYGDLLQIPGNGAIASRMTFRFGDGSFFEETVTFTQKRSFQMQSYGFEMRGPSFPHDQKISMKRATGAYRVETKSHKDGKVEVHEGTLKLPDDVYNGMVITLAKNLTNQPRTRVHFVAFMPRPRLIEIDLAVANSQKVMLGPISRNAAHFVIKPQLGGVMQLLAKLLRKLPPDNHVWIMTNDVPAFVRSDGPLYTNGPVWRVELSTPRWPGK